MTGLKIFVTGASGFIGQALVIKMLQQGHHIVATDGLVSSLDLFNALQDQYQSSFLGLKVDLLNQPELLLHMAGCDCVIQLMSHDQDSIHKQIAFANHTTQVLLQASVEAHIKKFIHISSTAVYGDPSPSSVITEESPYLASIIPQTSIQQAVERLLLDSETDDTEVIILQPSRVYGPGETGETARMLHQMKAALMPLVRNGIGYCNPIYMDDVVTAILRACEIPHLHRERFIISPDQVISWSEFLTSYESILGEKTFINLPIDYCCNPQDSIPPLRTFVSQLLKKKKIMEGTRVIAKALYGKPIHYPSPDEFRTMAAQPIFSNQKARDRLNFQPEISLQAGMDKIREWWHQRSIKNTIN